MNCELCGLSDSRFYKADIEGAVLTVCQTCAKYGKIMGEVNEEKAKESKSQRSATLSLYSEKELRENYKEIINAAIAGAGIDLEQLASEIKESPYDLKKIVAGKMIPQEAIALKLEGALKISLFEEINVPFRDKSKKMELSFGDVVDIKKKNKQG